jgi:hypothetical protein
MPQQTGREDVIRISGPELSVPAETAASLGMIHLRTDDQRRQVWVFVSSDTSRSRRTSTIARRSRSSGASAAGLLCRSRQTEFRHDVHPVESGLRIRRYGDVRAVDSDRRRVEASLPLEA